MSCRCRESYCECPPPAEPAGPIVLTELRELTQDEMRELNNRGLVIQYAGLKLRGWYLGYWTVREDTHHPRPSATGQTLVGAVENFIKNIGKAPPPEPTSALVDLVVAKQPPPSQGGMEVTPWLLGWMAAAGVGEDVVEAVKVRHDFGLRKYGEPLRTEDGRDPVADLAQELADALVYLARLRMLGEDAAVVRPLLDALVRLWPTATK